MIYRYLPYRLTLDSPVVISTLGGDPNSSGCLPYIPGSVMRGAIAGRLGDPFKGEIPQQEFRDLILGGKVRWLNAYPAHGKRRALPVPLSLRKSKNPVGDDGKTLDLAAYAKDGQWPEEQVVSIGSAFLNLGASRLSLVRPRMMMRLHHRRDRAKGRAWKDKKGQTHGVMFTFESLAEGQEFIGMVQVRGASDEECNELAKRIREQIGEIVLIGRSKKAGYGGNARIVWLDEQEKEATGTGFKGMRFLSDSVPKGSFFRLLFVSDAVFRDPCTGQVDPGVLDRTIAACFQNQVEVKATFVRTGLAGGFNRKWRLEVPQVRTVAAGSVVLLKAEDDIPKDLVDRIAHEGVGERKAEGFGRVVLLDNPVKVLHIGEAEEEHGSKPPKPEGNSPELVAFIEQRILDERLSERITDTAHDVASSAQGIPSNSLLGRLRTPLRKAPEAGLEDLRAWLSSDNENERLKKPAMEQLEKCKVRANGSSKNLENLKEWLVHVLEEEDLIGRFNAEALIQKYHIVSEESARRHLVDKSAELKARFIDAVLSALALKNRLQEVASNE